MAFPAGGFCWRKGFTALLMQLVDLDYGGNVRVLLNGEGAKYSFNINAHLKNNTPMTKLVNVFEHTWRVRRECKSYKTAAWIVIATGNCRHDTARVIS